MKNSILAFYQFFWIKYVSILTTGNFVAIEVTEGNEDFFSNQAYVLKTNKNTDTLQIVIHKTHSFCTKKLNIFHFIQTKTLKKPDFSHCLMEKIPLKYKPKESLIV